jgi:hypothetical protein|tara:strand:+ start:7586 stop:7756 length:171 start_codon:yes stop_codon:yes gene_type:complete
MVNANLSDYERKNDTNNQYIKCEHEWEDNIPVRNGSQDGNAGQHCIKCYKERNNNE